MAALRRLARAAAMADPAIVGRKLKECEASEEHMPKRK
jgi:hypothetical protein